MNIIIVFVVVVCVAACVGALSGFFVFGIAMLVVLLFGDDNRSTKADVVVKPQQMDVFFQECFEQIEMCLAAVERCSGLKRAQRAVLVELAADISLARRHVVAVERVVYVPGPKHPGEVKRAVIIRETARQQLFRLVGLLTELSAPLDPKRVQDQRVESILQACTQGVDETIAILQGTRRIDSAFLQSTSSDQTDGEERIPSKEDMH